VLEAQDGVDGVGRFLIHQPDVLLTDISMPKTDGLEMLHVLTRVNALQDTRIVVMSGVLTLTEDIKRKTKAIALLSKPFKLHDLYLAVGDEDAPEKDDDTDEDQEDNDPTTSKED
jgi:CheY-like chemotaxis protein